MRIQVFAVTLEFERGAMADTVFVAVQSGHMGMIVEVDAGVVGQWLAPTGSYLKR